MSNLFKSYKFILTPVTPLHIGNGERVLPYEYVYLNDYIYKLNLSVLYENLSQDNKRIFEKHMEMGLIALRDWINSFYNESLGYGSKIKASMSFSENYNKRHRGVSNSKEESSFVLNSFANNFGRAYIPGSSIKGALRSACLYSIGKKMNIFDYEVKKDNRGRIDVKKSEDEKAVSYEISILNRRGSFSDPFKSIKITDSMPVAEALQAHDISIFTLRKQGFEKDASCYALCTKSIYSSGGSVDFEMGMKIFDGYYTFGNVKIRINLDDILYYVNEKSSDMLENEIQFYTYKAKYYKTKELYENLKELYEKLDKNSEALIRIGQGSGFDSTTYNLANIGRSSQTESSSRNLAEGQYPLGWAVMKIV